MLLLSVGHPFALDLIQSDKGHITGGEEQAIMAERMVFNRRVVPFADRIGKIVTRMPVKVIVVRFTDIVNVKRHRSPFKGLNQVIKLTRQYVEIFFRITFKRRSANFPRCDQVATSGFNDVFMNVRRIRNVLGERDPFVKSHSVDELRDVYGVVVVRQERRCAVVGVARLIAPRFQF